MVQLLVKERSVPPRRMLNLSHRHNSGIRSRMSIVFPFGKAAAQRLPVRKPFVHKCVEVRPVIVHFQVGQFMYDDIFHQFSGRVRKFRAVCDEPLAEVT